MNGTRPGGGAVALRRRAARHRVQAVPATTAVAAARPRTEPATAGRRGADAR
jgi:hypothetical protein